MNTILLISLLISLFCVGLRIISSKGMLLYFLRRPYDLLGDIRKTKVAILKQFAAEKAKAKQGFDDYAKSDAVNADTLVKWKDHAQAKLEDFTAYRKKNMLFLVLSKIGIYIMKPIIGCGTCMASVWTFVWWPLLLNDPFDQYVILTAFIVAAFNSILIALFDLMSKYAK